MVKLGSIIKIFDDSYQKKYFNHAIINKINDKYKYNLYKIILCSSKLMYDFYIFIQG